MQPVNNGIAASTTQNTTPQPSEQPVEFIWACGETTGCIIPANKFSIWMIVIIAVIVVAIVFMALHLR